MVNRKISTQANYYTRKRQPLRILFARPMDLNLAYTSHSVFYFSTRFISIVQLLRERENGRWLPEKKG